MSPRVSATFPASSRLPFDIHPRSLSHFAHIATRSITLRLIGRRLPDDRWVSGSHDGNAALWYLAGSSYSLYPFSLLPSGALPNASLHIGAMPTVQWIRQPGNVLEMLSGGVYRATREGVGTLASGPVMGRDMLYLPVVDDDGMKHLPLHRMEFAEGAPCTEWY